jgi:hypothetical protein
MRAEGLDCAAGTPAKPALEARVRGQGMEPATTPGTPDPSYSHLALVEHA